MALGKITDCSNPETFPSNRNCLEARGKEALFEGLGREWGVCGGGVCLGREVLVAFLFRNFLSPNILL